MNYIFVIQGIVSIIALAFGIAIYFTSDDANHKMIGISLFSMIIGLWFDRPQNVEKEQVVLP